MTMVANSFDLWQKDTFFAAAEEVQQSADSMESAYRIWLKEKTTDGINFDQLCRDLHIALGTAKWQLEEFERAVKLSYGHFSRNDEDATSARHSLFITAIESQVTRVEESLRDALNEQGKQPFSWVHLDKQDNDDLAIFLSARTNNNTSSMSSGCQEGISVTKDSDADHVVHIENSHVPRDDVICQMDTSSGARALCGSSKFGALRIVVSDEEELVKNPLSVTEDTPKVKELRPFFGRQRCGQYFLANGSLFSKVLGRINVCQQQRKGATQLKFVHSVRLTLVLMLSIFLIVPFLLYSS